MTVVLIVAAVVVVLMLAAFLFMAIDMARMGVSVDRRTGRPYVYDDDRFDRAFGEPSEAEAER